MSKKRLVIAAVGVVLLYIAVHVRGQDTQTAYYNQQIEAAETMQTMMAAIRHERLARGLVIDQALDPLDTGMIGFPWPEFDALSITTTSGYLPAKQHAVNPNYAALMVRYFHDLGLKRGDTIAVYFSGSFPSLNIATLAAVETMGLKARVASSLGASSYGANHINFHWIDMEDHLYTTGLITERSHWVSLGGENDRLEEVTDESFKVALRTQIVAKGYVFIDEPNFADNVAQRYRAYRQTGVNIAAFVNVGGSIVSMGRHERGYPSGLTQRLSVRVSKQSGLMDLFFRDDVPVIHLLNITDLSRRYALQTDTDQHFTLGKGTMYVDTRYQPLYAVGAFCWVTGVLFLEPLIIKIRALNLKRTVKHEENVRRH